MILTDENDIYIFFEVIKQLEPQKILDIGMFLKRTGSISRRAMNCEVPEEVRLDGIDFFSEMNFPVWKNVYNQIMSPEQFLEKNTVREYDLIILLGVKEIQNRSELPEMIKAVKHGSGYLLLDELSDVWAAQKDTGIIELNVEQNIYFLLKFGEQ